MKKIGIIVNLNSREYKLKKNNPYGKFENIGSQYVIVRYTKSIEEIYEVAKEFKNMKIEYIAPSGGDGTLHHVISQFSKVYNKNIPPLLILKSGTMNNVATSIGLKGDAVSILQRAVKSLENNTMLTIIKRNTLKIGSNYCFLFGNGLTADFLDRYYTIGKSYTKLIHLIYRTIVEAFSNSQSDLFKGFSGTIICDGVMLPYENILGILGGTVETIGMGFYPLYRANEKEDAFHVIVCAMRPIDLALRIIKLKNGIPIYNTKYYENTIKELEIQSEKPFMYTMDGDLYQSSGTLNVTIGIPVHFIIV